MVGMLEVFQSTTRGKGHDPGSRIIQEEEKVFQRQKRVGNGWNMLTMRTPQEQLLSQNKWKQSLERVAESELPKVPSLPTGVLTKWSWTGVRNHSDGKSRILPDVEYEMRNSP